MGEIFTVQDLLLRIEKLEEDNRKIRKRLKWLEAQEAKRIRERTRRLTDARKKKKEA